MLTLIVVAALVLPPQSTDAVIGVTAIHLESGRRVSVRGGEAFPMGSVYKLPIVLTALQQVQQGKFKLDRQIVIQPKDFSIGHSPLRDKADGKPITLTFRELLRHTVSMSDNTASDFLLGLVGGPAVVTKRMKELGAPRIRIDRSERTISDHINLPGGRRKFFTDPRDTATPDDMARLLVAFWNRKDGLSQAHHDLLMKWLIDTPTGPRRVKAAVPKGSIVAHKTGTMPGTVNDAAIVTSPDGKDHVVLVVFSRAATTTDVEVREDDVAAAAKKAYDAVVAH
jgi:beta-lactamase class A